MLSLLMMARQSEIIAMQANGIDALNIARPVLILGLCASILVFFLNETVIPWSNSESERIQRRIEGKKDTTFFRKEEIWLRSPHSITHIGKFNREKAILNRVSMVLWDEEYSFTKKLFADKAKWWTNHWIFYGVNCTTRLANGQFRVDMLPSMRAPLKNTPADFDTVEKPAKEMNLTQLGEYIALLEAEGQPPTRYPSSTGMTR